MTSQSKKPSPLVRIGGKYGLFAGLVLFIGLISLFYFDRHPFLLSFLFDLRVPIFLLFIFFAIKEFKDDVNNKLLHFWQGLALGLLVYVVSATVTSALLWVFSKWIDPSFVSEYVTGSIKSLEKDRELIVQSLGEERFTTALENLPSTTAGNLAFDYFLKTMPLGLLLTLIITLFTRTRTT